ncbi:MAG: hypothetical protein JWQ87_5217 [Candidatus Sulfotelmatobacter sp.]|nr:hypothetical protein [Candidatus Sulfotelmatobacter sp.]
MAIDVDVSFGSIIRHMKRGFAIVVIAVLAIGTLSCTSSKSTPAATPAVAKPTLPKDEQGNDLLMPEIVRAEQVQTDNHGVKTITVGNANGEYVLSCNMKADNCMTPMPEKDYYVFNKKTKWKFSGSTGYVTLAWLQGWSVSYPNGENIALIPSAGGASDEVGMYWLNSWSAEAKTGKQ